DAAAYTTTIVYDALDREVSRFAGGRELVAAQLAQYGAAVVLRRYDGDATNNGIGRLTEVQTTSGKTSMTYEARGLVQTRRYLIKVPGTGTQVDRTESTLYNALGAPRWTVYADTAFAGPTTIRFATDDRGLPASTTWINNSQQPLAGYAYTAAGGVASRVLGGVYDHAIERDPRGRVIRNEVRARLPNDPTLRPRAAIKYEYDGAGAVEAMTWGVAAEGALFVEPFAFAYDRQHQLISATGPAGYDASFVYSDAGRIHAATVDAAPDAVAVATRDVTYDYAADSDLETPDKLLDASGTWLDLGHDLAGNTTSRNGPEGAWTHIHDGFDRQREVIGPAGREVYWYDGDGQRVGVATYDADGVLERVRWNFGATEIWYTPAGTVTKTIAHVGPARIENRTHVEHVFADHYGHTMAVFNRQGAMLAGFVYGPFGEILRQAGTEVPEVLRRFNGKEHDERSGLIYYGYRYFDPLSLTWTQADPLYRLVPDLAWAEPRRMSAYAFSMNNALTYVDPDGHDNVPILSKIPNAPEPEWMQNLQRQLDWQSSQTEKAMQVQAGLLSAIFNPRATFMLFSSQASNHEEMVLPIVGFALTLKPLDSTPKIVSGSHGNMLKQAVGHLRARGGSASQLADLFERLAVQMDRLTGGSWTASRSVGADGAHIFLGRQGEALVISPTGEVLRGSLKDFTVGAKGLQPMYNTLKSLVQAPAAPATPPPKPPAPAAGLPAVETE
nr:RHS repeat-associated core domain-containing protein [Gemmatimonadaceae bacterium]